MKLARKVGSTSQIFQIFIQDSSSSTGAGLTGLTNASSGLVAYYHRDTDTTATAISLVTMTVGTFTSSGFKEIDATNMPGWYQFCPPNAAFNTGAVSVSFHLKGATNMAPLPIEIDLDPQVDVTHLLGTAWLTPGTAGTPDVNVKLWNGLTTVALPLVPTTAGRTLDVSTGGEAGVDWANVGSPTTTVTLSGTTVKTATDVETDTQDIQSRLPAALGANGNIKADVRDIAESAVSTSTAQIGVNIVNAGGTAWASGSLTSGVFASGAITAAAIAADAIGASELAADAVAEIADAIWDEDATGHQTQGTFGQAIGDPTSDSDTIWGLVNTNLNATVSSRLAPTVEGRTLDVTATGEAGIDWGNVGNQGTSVNLAATTVNLVNTLTTYTGNTLQTGDSFARLGAPAGASVSADILVIDNFVDDLESRIGTPSNLGSGATVAANLVDIEGQTDDIGVAGAGLTAIGDTRIANLDATVSSRMATYTQPTGFLAATFPAGTIANTTNITAGTITTATNVTTVNGLAANVITAAALASDTVVEIRSVASGTADSGTTTTMVDSARTEADIDYWKHELIVFTSGNIAGQSAIITGFDPDTDTITFSPATTQAVGTNTYEIWPTGDFLRPTVTGRTIDISSGGEAGLDWGNVGSQSTSVNLSATTVNLVNTITTYTGNTVQTGDSYSIVNHTTYGNAKLVRSTTPANTLDVSATGEAGVDWGNVGSPTTTVTLSGTTVKTATDVETDTQDIQSRLPSALVSGRIDASVGAYQSGLTPLQPTVAGRTLDVTTTGEAGIDWANIGGVTTTVNFTGTTIKTATDVETDTADIQSRLPAALVSGRIDSSIGSVASGAITEAGFNADTSKYQGKVWLVDDDSGSNDRYMACWFKNGEPIVSGITSPTIQVIKAADGTDLVASTAMTQIGATGFYRYVEGTNRFADGAGYVVKISATIDSGTRTWSQPVGRDT